MKQPLPVILVSALLMASCAAKVSDPFAEPSGLINVWPAPPEAPRVAHVMSITRHTDLFTETGFRSALARVFGGERDSRVVRPYAVAVHPGGALLVTDPGKGVVHMYDWGEGRYIRLGENLEGGFPSPVGVTVAADGTILVTDSRRVSVEHFSRKGVHLGDFAPEHKFLRPVGIATDTATGDILVADVQAHEIAVLDSAGNLKRTIGANGSEKGRFNFPTHISVTADQSLLVADSMNFRIQRLRIDGSPVSTYGQPGDARGDFANPKGITSIDPDVFVAVEGLFDSLVFFNSSGDLLMTLGTTGSGNGEFWLPAGLAYDPTRRLLFVADSYNSRVQVFRILDAARESAP